MKKYLLLLMMAFFGLPTMMAQTVDQMEEDEEDNDYPFTIVEQMPEFPGGPDSLFRYLGENVKYPVLASEIKMEGRTICQFIVGKDGAIRNVEVVRSSGWVELDKEAVRVLESMPNWIPGRQRGKVVSVKYTVPINFRLKSDE